MNDDLHADPVSYGVAGVLNTPPPAIPPDPVAHPGSVFDQLLAVLGLAANLGDPADTGQSQLEQADRELKTTDAQFKFPATEEGSASELAAVSQQDQLAQSFPQLASGVAGGIGAALQPLSQLTQQVAQVGQQSIQNGLSALQQGAGGEAFDADEFEDGFDDGFGDGPGEMDGDDTGDEFAGSRFPGTAPVAILGPPPTPSAATVPASVHTTQAMSSATPSQTTVPTGGISAMPTMPSGGLPGAGSDAKSDAKSEPKRVVAPSIKNGAPVLGRIATPPPTPAVRKRTQGEVAARRIVLANQNTDNGD